MMDLDRSFEDAGVDTEQAASGSPAPDAAGVQSSHPPRPDGRSTRRLARGRGWKLPIIDGPFAESKEL